MASKYEIIANKSSKTSDYFQVLGDFNYYLVIEVSGFLGTHLSSLEIKCFDSPNKNKRIAAKYTYYKLKSDSQNKDKKFLNLTDKIVMYYSDIGRFIKIEIKPILIKSSLATVIYGPIQPNEKFVKFWKTLQDVHEYTFPVQLYHKQKPQKEELLVTETFVQYQNI